MGSPECEGMKRIFLRFISAGIMALIGACATQPNIPERETPEAQLYLKTCTRCHGFPHPGRHTHREWDHYVNLMEGYMKTKGYPFSAQDKSTILIYLKRNAR